MKSGSYEEKPRVMTTAKSICIHNNKPNHAIHGKPQLPCRPSHLRHAHAPVLHNGDPGKGILNALRTSSVASSSPIWTPL